MEDQEAVSTFKLLLRFTLEEGLSKDKEMLIGNYIVQKVLPNTPHTPCSGFVKHLKETKSDKIYQLIFDSQEMKLLSG